VPLHFRKLAAFKCRRHSEIHQQFRQMLGGVIQFVDPLAHDL